MFSNYYSPLVELWQNPAKAWTKEEGDISDLCFHWNPFIACLIQLNLHNKHSCSIDLACEWTSSSDFHFLGVVEILRLRLHWVGWVSIDWCYINLQSPSCSTFKESLKIYHLHIWTATTAREACQFLLTFETVKSLCLTVDLIVMTGSNQKYIYILYYMYIYNFI